MRSRRTVISVATATAIVLVTAAPAAALTIKQNASDTISAGVGFSCNDNLGHHTDNEYLRRFDLEDDHALENAFTVTSVSFGVELADSAMSPSQPANVRLYTIAEGDALTFANMTQIQDVPITIVNADTGVLVTVSTNAAVADPTTTDLVVGLFTPNGQASGYKFFMGANSDAETDPSYIVAGACGVAEPATTGSIGFPNAHWVLFASGEEAPDPDADQDTVPDESDNCVNTPNTDQANHDDDADGDACDTDDDNDTILDGDDACSILEGNPLRPHAEGCPIVGRDLTGKFNDGQIKGKLTAEVSDCAAPIVVRRAAPAVGNVKVSYRKPDGTMVEKATMTDLEGNYKVNSGKILNNNQFWVKAPARLIPDVAYCRWTTLRDADSPTPKKAPKFTTVR